MFEYRPLCDFCLSPIMTYDEVTQDASVGFNLEMRSTGSPELSEDVDRVSQCDRHICWPCVNKFAGWRDVIEARWKAKKPVAIEKPAPADEQR